MIHLGDDAGGGASERSGKFVGNAMLVVAADGNQYFGVSSYVGSRHEQVFAHLQKYEIQEVLWMGEVEFTLNVIRGLKINRANEISRYYSRLSKDLIEGLRLNNNVNHISTILRDAHFKAIPFATTSEHLLPELPEILPNPRHDLSNIVQTLVSASNVLFSHKRTLDQKLRAVYLLQQDPKRRLMRTLWLLKFMARDEMRLWSSGKFEELEKFAKLVITNAPVLAIDRTSQIDRVKYKENLDRLRKDVIPSLDEVQIFTFKVTPTSAEWILGSDNEL